MSHASPRRFPAEHHEAELQRIMSIPAVAARMAQQPEIVQTFQVPDLGGYSTDGKRVYLDVDASKTLATPDLMRVVRHEHLEKTLIDLLGYSYPAAHEFAIVWEHKGDPNPAVYEARLEPFVKRVEHEKITNPPLDLDCHPYYDDPDAQDLKILARLAELGVRDAQHPQHKLEQGVVSYGSGHRDERCKFCVHFTSPSCALVQSPISPEGWCRLWTKKAKS